MSFAKDNISPAFFPSLVSIGHILPKWLGWISLTFILACFLSIAPMPKQLAFFLWVISDKAFVSSKICDSWFKVKKFFISLVNIWLFNISYMFISLLPFSILTSACSIFSFVFFITNCIVALIWFFISSLEVRMRLFLRSSVFSILFTFRLIFPLYFRQVIFISYHFISEKSNNSTIIFSFRYYFRHIIYSS